MKILVVVDMQNDFIDGALGTPEALSIVPKVAEYIRNFDGSAIVFTKDTHYDTCDINMTNYFDTMEGKKLPVLHCVYRSEGWKINADVLTASVDYTINNNIFSVQDVYKETFGSKVLVTDTIPKLFDSYNYDFDDNEDEIQLCGLCTDICVISNAMLIKAFNPNIKITVLKDLCAGTTPENHENALKAMAQCHIDIE